MGVSWGHLGATWEAMAIPSHPNLAKLGKYNAHELKTMFFNCSGRASVLDPSHQRMGFATTRGGCECLVCVIGLLGSRCEFSQKQKETMLSSTIQCFDPAMHMSSELLCKCWQQSRNETVPKNDYYFTCIQSLRTRAPSRRSP